ncbi:MAG: hypothetical protein HZC40_02865 [Chloroflexi bacterium]|nr:hypothetical protein [Chloroflexota bacterium]
MKPQEEKNVNGQENDKPAQPKRVLTAATLRHQAGIAVQTGVKAGGMKDGHWGEVKELDGW